MSQDRTEKATGRRRQRARDEGQFPYSQELTGTLTLLTCLAVLFYGGISPSKFRTFFETAMQAAATADTESAMTSLIRQAGVYFLLTAAPIFGAAVVAALVGNVLQGLPIHGKDATSLKWDRLNPIAGFSKLKTKFSPLEWAKLIILLVVAGAAMWSTANAFFPQIVATPALPLQSSSNLIRMLTLRIVTYIGVAIVVIAAADYFLQRWRFEKSIKQTKAEVKEDNRRLRKPANQGQVRQNRVKPHVAAGCPA